jgi:hypothetical protein
VTSRKTLSLFGRDMRSRGSSGPFSDWNIDSDSVSENRVVLTINESTVSPRFFAAASSPWF